MDLAITKVSVAILSFWYELICIIIRENAICSYDLRHTKRRSYVLRGNRIGLDIRVERYKL